MIDNARAAAWCIALTASAQPILILLFGFSGVHGNSIATASYLCLALGGILLFGSARDVRAGTLDFSLIAFVASVGISFTTNPSVSNPREMALLAITLASYPAARLLGQDHIPLIRQASFWVSGIIVALGVVVTVPV